ncbi:MAG: MATE family efflux transporter [Candidatus Riflebacteria bacterium]|nr:MATE family efflux transporter [Candidatus Riflebacteria bacterium]
MLQSAAYSMLGIVDRIMVGQLAENAISAVGIGGQIIFFIVTLAGAIASAISILAAQYNGAKDSHGMAVLAGSGMVIISFCSVVFGVFLFYSAFPLALWLSNGNQKIAQLSSEYIKIVSLSTPQVLLTFAIVGIMRSLKDTKTPLISSMTALLLNTGLNYLLINGNLGFPALGVAGAALATSISQTVSFFIALHFFQNRNFSDYSFKLRHIFLTNLNLSKKILRITIPIALDALFWQAASITYTRVISQAEKEALPAYFIYLGLRSMGYIPIGSLGTAAATLVGRNLGAGNPVRTDMIIRQAFKFCLMSAFVMSVLYNMLSGFYLDYFSVEPGVRNLAISLIRYFSVVIFFESIIVLMAGTLRAGGDAFAVSCITFSTFWLIGIPGAWFFGVYMSLGMKGCFIGIALESVFKAILFSWRQKSGNWAHNLVE